MISWLYVELVVSHVIWWITCSMKVRLKLFKWKPMACVFFRTHNMVPGSLYKKLFLLLTPTWNVSNRPQNWILIVLISQMCGRNGRKRRNCIGYRVAFTKRMMQYRWQLCRRDQSTTSAQNPTKHSRRYHATDCCRYFNSAGNVLCSSKEYNLRTIRLQNDHPRRSIV